MCKTTTMSLKIVAIEHQIKNHGGLEMLHKFVAGFKKDKSSNLILIFSEGKRRSVSVHQA